MEPSSNLKCSCYNKDDLPRTRYKKAGFFYRRCDKKRIQRFRCHQCLRYFSLSTHHPCFGQRKRHLNPWIFQLLCSGYSMRRSAMFLRCNRKTIVRKFRFLGLVVNQYYMNNPVQPKIKRLQFDDMETFEHTKCKPLSITLAVCATERKILDFEVSQMPAKGLLAKISREKYGYRKDERRQARNSLFTKLKPVVDKSCTLHSDQNPHYLPDVKKHFPGHIHETVKGRRGCIVGQGELKRGGFDPLYSLNHTCAMIRENLRRLSRRTWCTTKNKNDLNNHLMIYKFFHNEYLLKSKKQKVSWRNNILVE